MFWTTCEQLLQCKNRIIDGFKTIDRVKATTVHCNWQKNGGETKPIHD